MKVLSVRQPWAHAIIHCGKDVENRSWKTDYRGLLLIHAGMKFDMTNDDFERYLRNEFGRPWSDMAEHFIKTYDCIGNEDRGKIIGHVTLVDCIPARQCKSKWAYGHDGYCWILESPTALEVPIACKGALGLFDPPRLTFGGQP